MLVFKLACLLACILATASALPASSSSSTLATLAATHGWLWDGVTSPVPNPPPISDNGTTATDIAACLAGTGPYRLEYTEDDMFVLMHRDNEQFPAMVNCLILLGSPPVFYQERSDLPEAQDEVADGMVIGSRIDPTASIVTVDSQRWGKTQKPSSIPVDVPVNVC
ncbi:hypothetical protein PSEUBRA_003406 [Kalmanozyma brasiliensis GHG001]|uniref:uncharacterized protein n=1 Tax=Kalmanozyma brasiliensis (strain GHG001) TaxID=1365824 RepID=UPI002867D6AA|nr:uncharacterized protein PSEUBRA_003406 [Kalmanozyma brasiliensis GHG001]KAF6767237.1 hypothetical protein PSEUBRA_003406 [Kalmanozyma brasiliensis GHG001]